MATGDGNVRVNPSQGTSVGGKLHRSLLIVITVNVINKLMLSITECYQ
jgi:hypothetical protein